MPIITTSGNIGKVDLRIIGSTPILSVSVADERYDYKKKENVTEWVTCKWLGNQAEKLAYVMTNAKTIVAIGQEQYRVYEGKLIREMLVSHHNILAWKSRDKKQKKADPFEDSTPIEISDEDLPF